MKRILERPPSSRMSSSRDKKEEGENKPKVLYLAYICGISERTERSCRSIGMKPVFKSCHTLRHSLMNVKNRIQEERRKSIVYEILCAECDTV